LQPALEPPTKALPSIFGDVEDVVVALPVPVADEEDKDGDDDVESIAPDSEPDLEECASSYEALGADSDEEDVDGREREESDAIEKEPDVTEKERLDETVPEFEQEPETTVPETLSHEEVEESSQVQPAVPENVPEQLKDAAASHKPDQEEEGTTVPSEVEAEEPEVVQIENRGSEQQVPPPSSPPRVAIPFSERCEVEVTGDVIGATCVAADLESREPVEESEPKSSSPTCEVGTVSPWESVKSLPDSKVEFDASASEEVAVPEEVALGETSSVVEEVGEVRAVPEEHQPSETQPVEVEASDGPDVDSFEDKREEESVEVPTSEQVLVDAPCEQPSE
jgi:hypothetical protein